MGKSDIHNAKQGLFWFADVIQIDHSGRYRINV